MSIRSSRRPPRRSRPTATPRCGSSRSAAPTCSRCACGAVRTSGSGCTAAGGTPTPGAGTRRQARARAACFRLPRAMPSESTIVKRLLIVAPNWLGDAVMALPAIADLRRAMPDAAITVAGRRAIAPLFALVPDVNAGTLDGSYDAALLLPNSFHSAWTAYRAQVPKRWGFRTDWRGSLLTRAVAAPSGVHQVEYYQQLVRALGFPNGPSEPRLTISSDRRDAAAALLAKAGWDGRRRLAALAPGAAYGGAKRWAPES